MCCLFPVDSDLHKKTYLKQKAELIQPRERHVTLLLDDMCSAQTTYKGGHVIGNCPLEQATTVQTFMLCSLLSSKKDVAALLPFKSPSAENLNNTPNR
jgi:hypothetical protein